MVTLPAVALTGLPQTIPIGVDPGSRLSQLRLANESYYALQVQIAGDSHWLDPWTADVFVVPQVLSQIGIVSSLLVSPAPPSLSASLLITVAEQGEQIPGTYPMALTRQAGAYSSSTELNHFDPGAGATQSASLRLPAGTHALVLVSPNMGNIGNSGEVKITGDRTGTVYFDHFGGGLSFWSQNMPLFLLVDQASDPTVTVKVVNAGAGGVDLYVGAVLDPTVVAVALSQNANVSVVQSSWQAADSPPVRIAASINAGSNVTLVPAVVGQRVFLFSLSCAVDAVAATAIAQLQDSGGTAYLDWPLAATPGPYEQSFYAAPLPFDLGVRLANAGTAAATFRGSLAFSQA